MSEDDGDGITQKEKKEREKVTTETTTGTSETTELEWRQVDADTLSDMPAEQRRYFEIVSDDAEIEKIEAMRLCDVLKVKSQSSVYRMRYCVRILGVDTIRSILREYENVTLSQLHQYASAYASPVSV